MIAPMVGSTPLKPGSATLPFFGVEVCLLDEKGEEILVGGRMMGLMENSGPAAVWIEKSACWRRRARRSRWEGLI